MSWQTDFNAGASSFLTVSDLLTTVQGVGATIGLIFAAWFLVKSYLEWSKGELRISGVFGVAIRAVLILSIVLFLLIQF